MRYRPFGRTGLQVSELVFGGGWVGGILIHQDDDTKRAAIERALEAGINWIDTAPSYGDGQSEQALGWLLQEVAKKPYLSTKVRLDLGRLDDIRARSRQPGAEPRAAALRLGRPVPAAQPDRAADRERADRGRSGPRRGRRRRRARPRARAGPHPVHRDHRVRRDRGLPRGDRERPLRFGPGLLQHAQSERRPGHAASLAGPGLPWPDRGLQGARRRGHEHPRARGRRARDRACATAARP